MDPSLYDDKTQKGLIDMAFKITGNRECAQDAVQDVILNLLEKPELLDNADDPAGYIRACVRHRSIRILDSNRKRNKAYPSMDLMEEEQNNCFKSDNPTVEDMVSMEQFIERVDQKLSQLPTYDRSIYRLSVYEGLNIREISEKMGLPKDMIGYRLKKAKELIEEIEND